MQADTISPQAVVGHHWLLLFGSCCNACHTCNTVSHSTCIGPKSCCQTSHVGVHCMSVSVGVGVTSTDWLLVTNVLRAGRLCMQGWQMQHSCRLPHQNYYRQHGMCPANVHSHPPFPLLKCRSWCSSAS